MRPLLFDRNLPSRLLNRLADLYPDSSHVELLGLGRAFGMDVCAPA
ncbi:MAG: DUF5615 family PIN-like protein [Caldilineaceae bacterium]|nr:DUF5615 family PIN-like protein [Caldilineaceae bacterium]